MTKKLQKEFRIYNSNQELLLVTDNITEAAGFLMCSETFLRSKLNNGLFKLPKRSTQVRVQFTKSYINDYSKEQQIELNYQKSIRDLKVIKGFDNIKEVPGFEGVYACKDGSIFKKSSTGILKECKYHKVQGRTHIYYKVALFGIESMVSRVIAKTFLDETLPLNDTKGNRKRNTFLDVDHIDSNPANNTLENLQILTHSENLMKRADEIGGWGKPNLETYVYDKQTKKYKKFSRINEACRYLCELHNRNYNPGYTARAKAQKFALFGRYGIGNTKQEARLNGGK